MDDLTYNWCRACGCKLWSKYWQAIGFCPECETESENESTDLEDMLESVINQPEIRNA